MWLKTLTYVKSSWCSERISRTRIFPIGRQFGIASKICGRSILASSKTTWRYVTQAIASTHSHLMHDLNRALLERFLWRWTSGLTPIYHHSWPSPHIGSKPSWRICQMAPSMTSISVLIWLASTKFRVAIMVSILHKLFFISLTIFQLHQK